MEAVDLRYELEGMNEIHEMPARDGDMNCGRQELRGEEISAELGNTHRSLRSSNGVDGMAGSMSVPSALVEYRNSE